MTEGLVDGNMIGMSTHTSAIKRQNQTDGVVLDVFEDQGGDQCSAPLNRWIIWKLFVIYDGDMVGWDSQNCTAVQQFLFALQSLIVVIAC